MNSPFPAPRRDWVRRVVEVLVAIAVVAVAAAAFVFSYSGVHALALLGGMSAQLARYYPALFDAVLVIACVTAVMLRDGRWWARLWAWVVVTIVLAAIGSADVLYATNETLSHQETAGAVAAAPAAAVLLAFSLLVALLQRPRAQPGVGLADLGLAAHPGLAAGPPVAPPAAPPTVEIPAVAAPPVPGPIALPPAPAGPAADVDLPAPAAEDAVTGVAPPQAEPEPEPVLDPGPAHTPTPQSRPHGIRYAGGGFSGLAERTATKTGPAAAAAAPAPEAPDYWAREEPGSLAGLVYQERAGSAAPGETGQDHDPDGPNLADQRPAPELDDDAPPFATAPFASVPRLNRVRSTPVPPADERE